MKKPLFFLAMIGMLAGCGQRENLAQLKAISKSLETANAIIQDDNTLIREALLEKRRDPLYNSFGEVWEPRASRIKKQADSIVVLIEGLKGMLIRQSDSLKENRAPLIEELYTSDGHGYKLVSRLAAFKDSFPAIIRVNDFVDNPVKHANLKKNISRLYSTVPLLPGYTDGLNTDQRRLYAKSWLEENFSGTSAAMAMVVLNRIENDVLATAKAFMDFCSNQIDVFTCGWVSSFHALATLNTSYVKQGQPIEVTAGVGNFNDAMKPRITMNGKEIKLDQDATAIHRFTANGKPGKHSIKVQIEFTKPDGTLERLSKKLEYIIADEK